MIRSIIVVSFAILLCSAVATNVKRCSKDRPFPLSVSIKGCEEPPCDVIKGTTAVMEVHFVSTKDDIRNLNAIVRATTLGITINYDLPEDVSNVCKNLLYGAECPLDKTEDVVYKFNFFIEPLYPEISVKIEVSLVDEEDDSIACFVTNIKVKKGAINPNLIADANRLP